MNISNDHDTGCRIEMTCSYCRHDFMARARHVKAKKAQGLTNFFCCTSCSANFKSHYFKSLLTPEKIEEKKQKNREKSRIYWQANKDKINAKKVKDKKIKELLKSANVNETKHLLPFGNAN